MSAWLVVVVVWLYVAVVVGSCMMHWKHVYERVQMNRERRERKKPPSTGGSMIRSMCSIRALEKQATIVSEMASSSIPYAELKDVNALKVVSRSQSLPSIPEERKKRPECTASSSLES